MGNIYNGIARWNAPDDHELHNRAERCAPLWGLILGATPSLLQRSQHSLTVRRYTWSDFEDVLIDPWILHSGQRLHTCVYQDDVIVMINLRRLRGVEAALPIWWCKSWGLRYAVTLAVLDGHGVPYFKERRPGIVRAIRSS